MAIYPSFIILITLIFAIGCFPQSDPTDVLSNESESNSINETSGALDTANRSDTSDNFSNLTAIKDPKEITKAIALYEEEVATLQRQALITINNGEDIYLEHLWALEQQKQRSKETLQAILRDKKRTITAKARAAHALIQLGDTSGEEYLFTALESKDSETRLQSLKMLGDWFIEIDFNNDGRTETILNMLVDSDKSVRLEAIKLATNKQLSGTEEKLIKLIEDDYFDDPSTVCEQLLKVATKPKSVEVMLPFLFDPTQESHSAWLTFPLKVLLENPDPKVSVPIGKALHAHTLNYPNERYEQSLAHALTRTADEDSLDILEDIHINARDLTSRLYALKAIARLQPETAVERIVQHIESDRSSRMAIEILTEHASEEDANTIIPIIDKGSESISIETTKLMFDQLGEKGREHIQANRQRLSPQAEMWVAWKLEGLNLETAFNDLKEVIVNSKSFEETLLGMNAIRKKDEMPEVDITDPSELVALLGYTKQLIAFDVETGMLPCNHDRLFLDFAHTTLGDL